MGEAGLRLSRLPGKRELAALLILWREGPDLNLEEALWLLRERLCVTKRTARNIVKRLRKLGLARVYSTGDELRVEVSDPCEALRAVAESYAERRASRCRLPEPR